MAHDEAAREFVQFAERIAGEKFEPRFLFAFPHRIAHEDLAVLLVRAVERAANRVFELRLPAELLLRGVARSFSILRKRRFSTMKIAAKMTAAKPTSAKANMRVVAAYGRAGRTTWTARSLVI